MVEVGCWRRGRAGLEEIEFPGLGDSLSPVAHGKLAIDVLEVSLDGVGGDAEGKRHFVIGLSRRQQGQEVQLAPAQGFDQGADRWRRTVTGARSLSFGASANAASRLAA